MTRKLQNMEGKQFTSNTCGDFTITKYITSTEVYVVFTQTGTPVRTRMNNIRAGQVEDPYFPKVLGVGFSGKGEFAHKTHGKLYDTWRNMLARCYCPKTQAINPTYVGITVCSDWYNFQTFAKWYTENHREGTHLDKDLRSLGTKEYSPSTCIFIPQQKNNEVAHAKDWVLQDPAGQIHTIHNLNTFAKAHNLHASCLYILFQGKVKQHKGWRLPPEPNH